MLMTFDVTSHLSLPLFIAVSLFMVQPGKETTKENIRTIRTNRPRVITKERRDRDLGCYAGCGVGVLRTRLLDGVQ